MKHSILKKLHQDICASWWYCAGLLCSISLLIRKITFIFDSAISTTQSKQSINLYLKSRR